MNGYTKLFGSIVGSTIWREPDHVRIVWITMLALKDRDHVVNVSLPGLADFARISLLKCKEALEVLKAPDEFSSSKEFGGRRIREVDGGWEILNGEKYHAKLSKLEKDEKNALRQARWRARQAAAKAEKEKQDAEWAAGGGKTQPTTSVPRKGRRSKPIPLVARVGDDEGTERILNELHDLDQERAAANQEPEGLV